MKSKSRDLLFQFLKKNFWTRLARIATFLHVLVVCHKHMCLSYNITRQIFLRAILFSTNCSKRIQQFTTLLKNVLLLCQCQGSKVTIFSFPHFRPPVFFCLMILSSAYTQLSSILFFIFSRLLYIRFIDKIVKVNLETALKFLFCFLFSFPSRVMMLLFHKLQEFTA